MRNIVIGIILVLLLLMNYASASYSISKTSTSGFNFKMVLDGNDLENAKSMSGALDYAGRSGDWVVNTYFSNLEDLSQIEEAFQQMGIPIPPSSQLTLALLKIGVGTKFYSMISSYAPEAKQKLEIGAYAPPFPARWYASYN